MKVLKERLPVLDEIDKALAEIYKFNQVDSNLLLFESSQFPRHRTWPTLM